MPVAFLTIRATTAQPPTVHISFILILRAICATPTELQRHRTVDVYPLKVDLACVVCDVVAVAKRSEHQEQHAILHYYDGLLIQGQTPTL
jgi:hypothetical protein